MTDSLSDRLAALIATRGLTQSSLAERIGVSRATVSAWCAGAKAPTRDNTARLAGELGVTPQYLEYGDAGKRSGPEDGQARAAERRRYATETGWYFREPPKDRGRELGNPATFAFIPSLESLARETGQNSADEKLEGETGVHMRFHVIELSGSHLDGFLAAIKWSELEPHLRASSESDQKSSVVIREGLRELETERRLVLIRIDDFNARGLIGPEYESGNFAAVARNTLDSFKGEMATGSFGLGKAAMWAASRFGLVLINSTLSVAEEGRRDARFIGRLEIPWHQDSEGRAWAGPGWFGKLQDDGVAGSYWGNLSLLEDVHLLRTDSAPGTSFLIVGAFDPSGDAISSDQMHDALAEAMARNFWAAMVETDDEPARLRVGVVTSKNGLVLRDTIVDPSAYSELTGRVELLRAYRSGAISDEFDDEGSVVVREALLQIPKRHDSAGGGHDAIDHDALVIIAPAEEGSPDANVVSYMRGSLMTIEQRVLRGLPLGSQSFRAVVLAGLAAGADPGDRAAERFLRSAENPQHNRWEGTTDLTTRYAIGAKSRLSEFFDNVKMRVREVVTKQIDDPDDGPEGLKELLRITPPKPEAEARPRVRELSGAPDPISGAWSVDVTVSLPKRKAPKADDPWVFDPVLSYGTESGPSIGVKWDSIDPVADCELTERGRLISRSGARTARFRAVTDPSSHPVGSSRAKVIVDVRTSTGGVG